jgi:hypothetical protein
MSIYKKLLEIQKEVNGLKKDKKAFGFDYVTGGKLLSFIKPLMNESGLLLKQEITSIENVRQNYSTKNGTKEEILSKVMMMFTWIDVETGEKDENTFGANGQNGWDKGVGSALTYAERYFILKYFHISTDEDDIDNPEIREQNEKDLEAQRVALEEQKKALEGRKPALKDSQLQAVLKSKNKEHAKIFLDKCRMADDERTQLKAILNGSK